MENTIVMVVTEDENKVNLSVSTNVNISTGTRFRVVKALMDSPDIDIDWTNPIDCVVFEGAMRMVQAEKSEVRHES